MPGEGACVFVPDVCPRLSPLSPPRKEITMRQQRQPVPDRDLDGHTAHLNHPAPEDQRKPPHTPECVRADKADEAYERRIDEMLAERDVDDAGS